ncbi:proton-coupled zinc antiporter SLC30A2 isoform X2 [Grus americana]|uniref:proton-coupled zinc antiporter SLC30A2 isoform X2 n=1 Tax=Grus americana TaxID=9117 RepID=UPI002407DFFC|nr:proton-coupled zinc antiporter SLC30A2 isoform X2 [Grus americana]
MPWRAVSGGCPWGSQSNPPPLHQQAPGCRVSRPTPGQAAAGALQPAWPSLPRPGFAHESPALHTGRGHRLPPAPATHRGHPPRPPAPEDGSRRGETAPAERGRRRVGGCPGRGGLVSPLPCGAPRWGPLEVSGQGRGWWGEAFSVQSAPQKSFGAPPLQPLTAPLPGRSYLGAVQKNGHNSVQGQAPALEMGTQRSRHCHARGAAGHPGQQQRARRKLYLAAGICLVFMVGEAVGGYLAHSLAILTDAAHLLTDFASIMISLFALWVSSRPPTKTMNFGWHRAEILGALLSVLSIWVVTGVLVYLAAQRLLSADYDIEGSVMLITSACAVAVNVVMGVALHQTGHGHSHGVASEQPNASVRAAFVHVVGDLLQSVGVLIASYIIFFKPEYKYVDPICTFLFSALVLGTTLTILRDVLLVLMEGTPKGMDFNAVRETLLAVGGVEAVHSLHIWALTAAQPLLSVHIAISECRSRGSDGAGEGFGVHPHPDIPSFAPCRRGCQRAGGAGGGQLPAAGHLPLPHHHHPGGELLRGDAGLPGVPAPP